MTKEERFDACGIVYCPKARMSVECNAVCEHCSEGIAQEMDSNENLRDLY